jgi:hypothetical protein
MMDPKEEVLGRPGRNSAPRLPDEAAGRLQA